ncbi:MAG: hypothetical protein M3P95_02650 [Actinomycetota bacterium]|jgi:hypothetical protein|nr:hypothetical protein [Actinomycetota bacterium]
MTRRTTAPGRRTAPRAASLVLAGLGLAGALTGCGSQSGDSVPDRQSETVPVPGEPSASPY